jgi:hypothetical protein
MAQRQIDIFAGLRRVKAGSREKMVIEFRAPELMVDIGDPEAMKGVAEACAQVMRENMLAGLTPSGAPLPPAKASTIERRRYRELQGDREGDVAPRFSRSSKASRKFYRNAKRSFFKRYKTKIGLFTPSGPGVIRGRFGVESGLLAKSLVGVPSGEGRYKVVAANARSIVDAKSGKSAMGRVFGQGGIAAWSKHAMRDPRIQNALKEAQAAMFKRQRRDFARALVQTAQSVSSLAETATDVE